MKLWQKIGIAAGGLLAGSWLLKSATGGVGAPAATPHGGTVAPNGTTVQPSNSGISAQPIVTGALTGAGFILGQTAVNKIKSLLPGGSSTPEATAAEADASVVPTEGSAAETAAGGAADPGASSSVAEEAAVDGPGGLVETETAAEGATATEATGVVGELESLIGGVGGEAVAAVEAAPELAMLAL